MYQFRRKCNRDRLAQQPNLRDAKNPVAFAAHSLESFSEMQNQSSIIVTMIIISDATGARLTPI
jgi:hypothetical protein